MSKVIVQIKDLIKTFKNQPKNSIDSLSTNFDEGKIIGLVGPDGAGKTTLIRLLCGLLKPTSGSIQVNGLDPLSQSKELHQIISYLPQTFGLYEDLTVLQNLNLYAQIKMVEEPQKKIESLLEFTKLKSFEKRFAKNLSGGMKQKLAIACALLSKPICFILDEPSVGIDPIAKKELWEIVSSLKKEKTTIIWSTSYLDEAEKCDQVLLLNEGKVLYDGPPKVLTEKLRGKVFQIQNISTNKKKVLFNALEDERIKDTTIQGKNIHLLLKDAKDLPDLAPLDAGSEAKLVEEKKPSFEDAFIDILGGYSKKVQNHIPSLVKVKTTDKEFLIEAKNISKQFDSFTAVKDINFSVKRGEIFGLLGPNGAGKSTTFKMLCGLLKPSHGDAFISGISLLSAPSQARSTIGYMAQKFSLYGQLTVLQNLNFFAGIYSIAFFQRKKIIEEMITRFSLEPYLDKAAGTLPLGFKQRLALACSTMHSPEVLFLDEPTSGVDPLTRREFWYFINRLVEKGVTVMITTHLMDEAEYFDRIGLIDEGILIKIGSPDELKESVKTEKLPCPSLEDAFIIYSQKGSTHV